MAEQCLWTGTTFDTRCLHAGQKPDPGTSQGGPYLSDQLVCIPGRRACGGALQPSEETGNIYTRMGNPTTSVFEDRMASLEGGVGALRAVSSGQAAQVLATTTLCEAGDEFVSASTLYGGTFTLFDATLRRLGSNARCLWIRTIRKTSAGRSPTKTRFTYGETIANPRMNVLDIERVAAIVHEARISAGDQQYLRFSFSMPPDRVWRRYCSAVRDQVYRRARHEHRRSDCGRR